MIRLLKILNVVSFILMITVNALANILPINGVTTGAVSDSYPNLFAPAGFTFAIWGLIYLLLAGFVVYQIWNFKNESQYSLFKVVSWCFIISSFANAAWIFSWHYFVIPLSMVLMIVILSSLIVANNKINSVELTNKEKWFVRLPFSVYFGWITVATIANATTFLVSIGWNGWGLSEQFWTIAVVSVGAIIGGSTILRNKDVAYGFVILWAYFGILAKHISANGFAGKYPGVITAVWISIIFVLALVVFVINKKKSIRTQRDDLYE